MKTKTFQEAYFEITEIIAAFQHMAEKKVTKMNATIENVGMIDLIIIHKMMITPNKRLFMPGELGTETMTMIYTPARGCTIAIESEPCVKLMPKINLINYN